MEALIHFTFAGNTCSNNGPGQFKVAKNTVLWYTVHLVKGIPLSDLEWNMALYERFEDPHLMNLVYYNNKTDGVRLVANRKNEIEKIEEISYTGSKRMSSKLICKKYRQR